MGLPRRWERISRVTDQLPPAEAGKPPDNWVMVRHVSLGTGFKRKSLPTNLVPNFRVLEIAVLTSVTTILSKRRKKWLGHV